MPGASLAFFSLMAALMSMTMREISVSVFPFASLMRALSADTFSRSLCRRAGRQAGEGEG